MKTYTPKVLVDSLVFPEGPRWHNGKLWFSDIHAHKVMTVDLKGKKGVVVEVPNRPSGLGFLPDGRLLIVSMLDKRLLRLDPKGLAQVADISSMCGGHANDMVVDGQGRAYIGNLGYDSSKEEFKTANIILVTPDGKARIAASDLAIPNGTVITPDGKTLIVGESRANCLTAFSIAADGSLSNRRVFAVLGGEHIPDGICLDAKGGVWLGSPRTGVFLRVEDGGKVTDTIPVPGKYAVACMLGGADRRTLFLLTAKTSREQLQKGVSTGWIETVQVDIPGAGWP